MSSFEPIALGARDTGASLEFVPLAFAARGDFDGAGRSRDEQREEIAKAQRAELEAALAKARRDGFEEARAEDREPLRAAIAALAELRRDYLAQSREGIVELALAIAERVVRHSLGEQADLLAAFVEHAVATVAAEGPIEVRLSPVDCERLETAEREAESAARAYALVPDRALRRGDVVVSSAFAELDARIASLLGIVRSSLLPEGSGPDGAPESAVRGGAR